MMWFLVFVGSIASAGTLVSAQCKPELNPESVVVGFGDSFSVKCSSSSNQTTGMGWESQQDGIALTEGVSTLTLEITSVKLWTLAPMCYINLNDSQCVEKLPVTVYKMPDSVSIQSQPGPVVEGEKLAVRCDVTNVAPAAHLSVLFHKGNNIVSTHTFSDLAKKPVNLSHAHDLILQRDDNGTVIWCEAKLNFMTKGLHLPSVRSKLREVVVLYPPTFNKPENETLEVRARDKIILNCNATGNPAPTYHWQSPQPVQQKDGDLNKNQLILTRSLQFPGTYTCIAGNTQGTATKHFTIVEAPGNRSTFAAIVGVFVFLGVVLVLAGLYFVKPDGTFSIDKASYQPTSSEPV